MTKKSASQFKVVDKPAQLKPIEDVFATQKAGMLATIDVQIKQDSRFDTLMAIKQSHDRFFNNGEFDIDFSLDEAKALAGSVRSEHEEIKKIIEAYTVEDATAEGFENPCDKLVDFMDPKSWEEVFEQSVFFSAIQPYGQAFDDLHARMMDEVAKRDA